MALIRCEEKWRRNFLLVTILNFPLLKHVNIVLLYISMFRLFVYKEGGVVHTQTCQEQGKDGKVPNRFPNHVLNQELYWNRLFAALVQKQCCTQ